MTCTRWSCQFEDGALLERPHAAGPLGVFLQASLVTCRCQSTIEGASSLAVQGQHEPDVDTVSIAGLGAGLRCEWDIYCPIPYRRQMGHGCGARPTLVQACFGPLAPGSRVDANLKLG